MSSTLRHECNADRRAVGRLAEAALALRTRSIARSTAMPAPVRPYNAAPRRPARLVLGLSLATLSALFAVLPRVSGLPPSVGAASVPPTLPASTAASSGEHRPSALTRPIAAIRVGQRVLTADVRDRTVHPSAVDLDT